MHIPTINFHSARLRLALTYLTIIMVLSLGFSFVFYQQSINEARFGFRGQENQLRDYLYFTTPEGVERIRNSQLSAFRLNLLRRLTVLNLGMLLAGGPLSYILAKRSLRPLETTIASQNRFTSDAAHELRTPLTAMKTEIEVNLRHRSLSVKEAKEALLSTLEEINKLDTLSGALLRLARTDQAANQSHFDTFKLNDILKEAFGRIKIKAKTKQIKIKLPNNSLTVFGDADQLVELFVILFDNAVKYSPEKSTITINATTQQDFIKVSVSDKGIGITAIDLPHIFERFYRADLSRTNAKENGYGLGLSLAQAIVVAHNGKISVKSQYEKGSTFIIELPDG